VFTDPYTDAPRNHWTPGLDAWAAALRDDIALKTVVARHRVSFLTNTQALIHGDLHSGSVMVTDDDTRVIDGEFAALGPVGFDLGAFIAHLLMSWFAQSAAGEAARSQCDWLLAQVVSFWERFDRQFRALWEAHAEGGDAFPASHFKTSAGQARLATIRHETVARIFGDTLAYAAIKIIRRNVGFAQVADFLAIDDLPARAHAQAGALSLARSLLLAPQAFPDIDAVATAVSRHALAGLDPASLRPQGRAARP